MPTRDQTEGIRRLNDRRRLDEATAKAAEPAGQDARRVDDNNSLLVSLTGSDGQRFTLGLRGDIEDKPEETALFFISRPNLVPYVYWPGFRSNDEKRVLNLLASWEKNRKAPSEGAEHAAYQIYSVLKDRN